jgi:beta-phosphoglucomutase
MSKAFKSRTFAAVYFPIIISRMYKNCRAVIFDMDGVLVDNFSFHLDAWEMFCANHGIQRDRKGLLAEFGGTNRDIFGRMFGKKLSEVEVNALENEKESLYRKLYHPFMAEVNGLTHFLERLKHKGFKVGMATSAPTPNVDMVADNLNIRRFFDAITDATYIQRGKPDPEIFLKCADSLNAKPSECVVFEDSVSGILAAQAAGMTAIALLTTHKKSELPKAHAYVRDFSPAELQQLNGIIEF